MSKTYAVSIYALDDIQEDLESISQATLDEMKALVKSGAGYIETPDFIIPVDKITRLSWEEEDD